MKLKLIATATAFLMASASFAATTMNIQVYNNLYNQGGTGGASGQTPTNITAQFFNGGTMCDSVAVGFRALINEIVGTGASQKCTTVSAVKIVAGTSSVDTNLQVYNTPAVTVNMTGADFEHSIVVQDLGTGVVGTPAADGSIAPVFDTTNGTLATKGTLGTVLNESKLY